MTQQQTEICFEKYRGQCTKECSEPERELCYKPIHVIDFLIGERE